MSNNNQDKTRVVKGKCLMCFYITIDNNGDSLVCARYGFEPKCLVESCPGFKPVSEGLHEVIVKMKEQGELYGI